MVHVKEIFETFFCFIHDNRTHSILQTFITSSKGVSGCKIDLFGHVQKIPLPSSGFLFSPLILPDGVELLGLV